MVIIPGFVISLLTFPGVIVHEAAHMLFCKLRGIAVLDVCFFRAGNPAGYVVHEEIKSFTSAFLVSVGPFIVNSLLCIFICFPAYLPMQVFRVHHPLSLLLMWLGLSIGMHAFPSNQDAASLLYYAKKAAKSLNPLAVFSFPLTFLIFIGNALSFIWADLAYGIALGIGLPSLLL
jgi:hypothetical protein